MTHPQLTLPLGAGRESSFESFYVSERNKDLVDAVRGFCEEQLDEQQMFIWGESEAGKTHLLSAACLAYSGKGYQVAYLTGELASNEFALQGMETYDLLCLDDVHLLQEGAEEALFHCINRCRETNVRLIFASAHNIEGLDIKLTDLRTRLQWGPVFHLSRVDDGELPDAFAMLLQERSLNVNEDVVEYVLRRYPRNMSALRQLVEQLDQVSLSEHRRITIPLIRELSESKV